VHLRSPSQALDGDDRIFRITPQTKLRVPTDYVMFASPTFVCNFSRLTSQAVLQAALEPRL
jgi:hypothetical protein